MDTPIIQEKKNELLDIRKKKLEGSFIRSRAKWVYEGEKPSKYFCNLESRHFVSKHMNGLYSKTGTFLQNQEEILLETMYHYKTLYSYQEV